MKLIRALLPILFISHIHMVLSVCLPEAFYYIDIVILSGSIKTYMTFCRVGQKYWYAGIPRYFCVVVCAHLPLPWYSGVSIFSNRKP